MVKISIEYAGELHCTAEHGPSGKKLETDAPVDNNGKGESFSPTDLAATAFGTCMMTIMGIVAQRHQVNLEGTKVEVTAKLEDPDISAAAFGAPPAAPVDASAAIRLSLSLLRSNATRVAP